MAGQALYLKYRPRTFDEVVGQDPIMRTLCNALRQGRFRHAYLFTGPRGTGKTTTARLLAKAVNCLAPEEERPCNACSICVAMNEARMLDLIEIDAASNRGIDEIRDLREKVNFRPNVARFKVYILDEAHMLTSEAFNALLKTLEEPPPHVVFVLVTTEPQKIPATIGSRCQRFDFRRVRLETVVKRLSHIAQQEGLTAEPAALELIAHQGGGAMRDAISLLDQMASYGEEIRVDQVQMVLGTVASEAASRLAACLADGDIPGGLDAINRTVSDGADPRQLGREVVETLRGLLLIQQGVAASLLNITREQADVLQALAKRMSGERLLRAIRLFNEATVNLRRGFESIPQLPLEMALVESLVGEVAPTAAPKQQFGAVPLRPAATAAVEPAVRQVAEEPLRPPAPEPEFASSAAAESGEREPGVSPQTAVGPLSLDQVQQAWKRVLLSIRQRNPTTQAVLASGCKPVEVNADQLTITVPSPILGDKLRDAQRTLEIEEALNEVLQTKCRLKLVLASEYVPRPQAAQVRAASVPQDRPSEPALQDQVPDSIAQWAEKVGGTAKVVRT